MHCKSIIKFAWHVALIEKLTTSVCLILFWGHACSVTVFLDSIPGTFDAIQFGKLWAQQSDLNTDKTSRLFFFNQTRAWLDCSKSNHPDLTQQQDVNETCCLLLLVRSIFYFILFFTLERQTIIWIWLFSGCLPRRNAGYSSQNCWCHYLQVISHWLFVFHTHLRNYFSSPVPFYTHLCKCFLVLCNVKLNLTKKKTNQKGIVRKELES